MFEVQVYSRIRPSLELPRNLAEFKLKGTVQFDSENHHYIAKQLDLKGSLRPGEGFTFKDKFIWFVGLSESGAPRTKVYFRSQDSPGYLFRKGLIAHVLEPRANQNQSKAKPKRMLLVGDLVPHLEGLIGRNYLEVEANSQGDLYGYPSELSLHEVEFKRNFAWVDTTRFEGLDPEIFEDFARPIPILE